MTISWLKMIESRDDFWFLLTNSWPKAAGLFGIRIPSQKRLVAMLNPAVSTTTVAWYVKPGWPTVGENRGGSEVWPWGAAVSSRSTGGNRFEKGESLDFFFDFMNEAWCPWFWKVYYRVMFSDGFCVFSSLFEINFKWFLNFKLGYRSFTRFGRVGTSIFIPKAQFFSKWPAKNQDLTSKDVLRCFLPDPAFPISNIQGSQRV